MLSDKGDGTTWLGITGSVQEAIRVGRAATDALGLAFFAMADLLGWEEQKKQLAAIAQANHQILNEMMDAVGFEAARQPPSAASRRSGRPGCGGRRPPSSWTPGRWR